MALRHFDKDFLKKTEKEALQGNILNEKFSPKMATIRAILPKTRTIFSMFKKGMGGVPSRS